MSSKSSYYTKGECSNSETVSLYKYPTSVCHALSSLVKSVETKLIRQRVSSVFEVMNKTETVGNWSPQLKSSVELQSSLQSFLPVHKTHRIIAELGADNETYKYTTEWLKQLRKIAAANQMWWGEPLVNLSVDSEVVFEWWYGSKKLTVYILGNTAEYVKVWGSDIDNEMEDGTSSSADEVTSLWKWLVS